LHLRDHRHHQGHFHLNFGDSLLLLLTKATPSLIPQTRTNHFISNHIRNRIPTHSMYTKTMLYRQTPTRRFSTAS
jgi:hypothetical protein